MLLLPDPLRNIMKLTKPETSFPNNVPSNLYQEPQLSNSQIQSLDSPINMRAY